MPVDQQELGVESPEPTLKVLGTIRPAKPAAEDDDATPSKHAA
jgi:hypothetical protein